MIDTIVIRVHNIDNYPLTVHKSFKQDEKAVIKAFTNTDTLAKNSDVFINYYADTGNFIPLISRGKCSYTPSSHYKVSYFLNTLENYIEYNFSIPKYIFGTNIFQFFGYFDQTNTKIFEDLKTFIINFLGKIFVEPVSNSDIEFNRIDICYNQFFNSKSDAINYLNWQKEKQQEINRSSKNRGRDYGTTLMTSNARYSFKIYHKGTEFAKHDIKELSKNNPHLYDLGFLQSEADKILRYEMTCRKSYLNYVFGQWFSAKSKHDENNPNYDPPYIVRFANDVLDKGGYHKLIDKFLTTQKYFLLTNRRPTFETFNDNRVNFDFQLFNDLFLRFWSLVTKYQVKKDFNPYAIIDRIKQDIELSKNIKYVKTETNNLSRMTTYILLSQHQNLAQLYKDGLLPHRTFYRIKKDLLKYGLDVYNPQTLQIAPRLDHYDYKIFLGALHYKHYAV